MVGVMFGGGATGYTLPSDGETGAPPSWAMVPAMATGGSIAIVMLENTTTSTRSATITFTPTGGEGTATPATLTITQQATPQTIMLNPTSLSSIAAAGSTETVTVTFGGGATGYTLPSDGETGAPPSWVTVPAMVDAMNNLEITIIANASTSARSATITFTPTGGMGTATSITLMINQLGVVPMGRSVTLDPVSLPNIPAAGGTRTVRLTLGGDATGYMTSGVEDWVTVPAMGMAGEVSITVRANMTAMIRSATITFTPTGGEGMATPATLTITQQAPPQTIMLDPDELDDVLAAGERRMVGVTLSGATGYTLPLAGAPGAPPSWAMVPAMATGGSIAIVILENTTTSTRSATITFTPTGGEGTATPATLTITQLGAAPAAQTIMLNPTSLSGIAAAGSTETVRLTYGGGATGYMVAGAATWAPVASPGMGNSVDIVIAENTTAMTRSAMVIFTPTGGEGTATPATLTITQAAATAAGPAVILSPTTLSVPVAGATRMVSIGLVGGATSYTVPTTGVGAPASWVTGISSTGMAGMLNIVVAANATTSERKDTIYFKPVGGTGTMRFDDTLTITQAAAPAISVSSMPTVLSMLPAAGDTVIATINISGTATGWRVMVPTSGFTTASPMSGTGNGMDTLIYAANMTNRVRRDTVVFSTTGGTGVARDTLVLIQQSPTSFGVADGVFADVRVVNPSSDKLIIYGLSSSARMSLRDVSGRVVFSATLTAGKQHVSLPPLARGVYLLALRNEEGETYNARLLME